MVHAARDEGLPVVERNRMYLRNVINSKTTEQAAGVRETKRVRSRAKQNQSARCSVKRVEGRIRISPFGYRVIASKYPVENLPRCEGLC
jgi:hypothetical protein